MSRDTLSFAYKKLIKKIAFLFVSFAMVFVLGASSVFAASYSCPTSNKKYTSCNAGYYLTSSSYGNSCASCSSAKNTTSTRSGTESCSKSCSIANGTCTYSNCTQSYTDTCSGYYTGGGGGTTVGSSKCTGCSAYSRTSTGTCGSCTISITCNTGYTQSGNTCVPKEYSCVSGNYLNGTTCSPCEPGYYCKGGTWTYNGGIQGRNSCSTDTNGGYPNSAAGSSSSAHCYLTTASTKYVAETGKGQVTCAAGGYCPGGTTVYYTSGVGSTTGGRTACSAGTKNAGTGSSSSSACTACAAGTYNTTTGNTSCSTCPAGSYCTGGSNKTACATNSSSAAGSDAISDCYCNAGYSGNAGTSGGSCTYCSAGTYKTSAGNTSCSTCPAGSYCTGGSNKTACVTNSSSPAGSDAKADCSCNAGYGGNAASGSCTYCSAGTYKTSAGNASCSTCTSNSYCTGGTHIAACTANSSSPAGSDAISDCSCNAGYSGNAGTSGGSCTYCSAGTYKTSAGNTSCSTCPAGSYCTGGSNKTACTANSSSPAGSDAKADCVCNAGYGGSGASDSCTYCSAGTYKTSAGNTSCSTCAYNSYCTGGTHIASCPNPTTYAPNSFPDDYYSPSIAIAELVTGTGSSAITQCQAYYLYDTSRGGFYEYSYYSSSAGRYTAAGNNYWWDVKAGYYLTDKAGCDNYFASYSTVKPCPANSYCPGKDSTWCDPSNQSTVLTTNFGLYGCPSGYPNSAAGATAITSCYSGTKSRAWSGGQNACSKPTNCATVTCNTCSKAACSYVAYSNSTGNGDGTIKSGCPSNSANCNQTVKSVTANANAYVDGTSCKTCSSFSSTYTKSDGGNIGSGYCYKDATKTGSQLACSKPANSYTYTCNACTPGTCSYRDYYDATDTTCTPTNCTQTATVTGCPASYYKDGNACSLCSGLANGLYPNSDNGNSSGTSACRTNSLSGKIIKTANATTTTDCDTKYYKTAHTVNYGSTSSCETCPATASGSDSGRDAKTDCYVSCSAKTISNGTTTVVNAKEYYNGSAYPACTFNVSCNAKHGASGNKTSNPACTACSTGQYSAGGTAICTACTNGPANSEYTNSASSNSCSWKCNSGYNQTDDNQCAQFCTSGITYLKTGSGVSVPLYTFARTTPALNVKVGSNSTCYGSLATGKSTNALNVKVGSTTYHAIK